MAFVAGDNKYLGAYSDLSAQPRDGYAQNASRNKSLLFLELDPTRDDLDLGDSSTTLKDLTGGDSRIYGDLLTPEYWLALKQRLADGEVFEVLLPYTVRNRTEHRGRILVPVANP